MLNGIIQIQENIFSLAMLRTNRSGSRIIGDWQYDFFYRFGQSILCIDNPAVYPRLLEFLHFDIHAVSRIGPQPRATGRGVVMK